MSSLTLLTGDDVAGALETLLTAAQVARIVGVPTKRVYELGIPAVRISARSLRWRPSTVAAWLRDREGSAA
ncbi:MAG TPA: helix-turn-helix domain-containing protein [Gemmatimonadales bacterium]|nr:helix-turn-helix domain-containing protein [Gemmatimonadales bacterium]